jgi:hypothetical protein
LSPIGYNTILLYRNRKPGCKSQHESIFVLLSAKSTYLKSFCYYLHQRTFIIADMTKIAG